MRILYGLKTDKNENFQQIRESGSGTLFSFCGADVCVEKMIKKFGLETTVRVTWRPKKGT